MDNIVDEVLGNLSDILKGDKRKLVDTAEKFGKYLAEKQLSTSQIRNIFSETKRMKSYEENKNDLLLLKPKLAYIAGRHGKRDKSGKLTGPVPDLARVLEKCIENIDDDDAFQNFKDFFEAILAYHRYYGGKE